MAENCQIYTPKEYVDELLTAVGYVEHLYGMSVLENSCGAGDILCTIVERYISSALLDGYSTEDIRNGLQRDICGTEINEESVEKCKDNLSGIAVKFDVFNVEWNIIHCDYLRYSLNRTFDYVIGNPPYIVYRDINKEDRVFIKQTFVSCRNWKFDYYYAFIEKSVNDLAQNGKMAYIIPYSFYKNVGAAAVRELVSPFITSIIDYTHSKKFPNVVTSSTVLILRKNISDSLEYNDANLNQKVQFQKNQFGEKWFFNNTDRGDGRYKFGDFFNVSNTIATLCNKAFVLEHFSIENGYYRVGDYRIEENIVKPALSRKKGSKAQDVAIIFPYKFENNLLLHYSEKEFLEKFPGAYEFLKKSKPELNKRASDKRAQWFEYGRSQALTTILSPKLVIPSIESTRVIVSEVDENTIPLAGFYITVKDTTHTLEEAKDILESDLFYSYLCKCGIFTTGKCRRLSVKDVLAYEFDEWK